jgi:hypothetical protein
LCIYLFIKELIELKLKEEEERKKYIHKEDKKVKKVKKDKEIEEFIQEND